MAYFRPAQALTFITILTLSLGSNAYAAGTGNGEEVKGVAATSGTPVTIVAANHRETNLRKTATSLFVMGVDVGRRLTNSGNN